MTEATRDLLKRALELTPAERADLVRQLRATLEDEDLGDDDAGDEELDPELAAELRRRAARADEPGVPADEAFAEVERRLTERSSNLRVLAIARSKRLPGCWRERLGSG